MLVHDHHSIQALTQKANAPVDFAQAAFAVRVLGVLGTITLGCGFGDRLRHFRTLHAPECVQLVAQTLRAIWSYIFGARRGRRTITSHR